jgi:hypothetical protein
MSQDLTAALFKAYTPLLDEAYKLASLTSKLDTASELIRYTQGSREVVVPKMTLQGLADYDRASGYVGGEASMTLETLTMNYERGRMFSIDSMDNEETAGVAYGRLAGEFLRSYVVPEIDAVRFATYAALAGTHPSDANINAAGWYALVSAAQVAMTEAEVPESDRHLFITATGHADILNKGLTESKVFFDNFASVTVVPQARFYEAVTLAASGAGGYARTTGANNINFLIIHKPAVIQVLKHQDAKIINPQQNQDADAWKFGYRVYGLNDVYDNKVKGIYVHTSLVTS